MSTLRSALDELRGEDLELASGEELSDGLVELERASRVLDAERSRRLIEVERRGAWSIDGHLSVVSWLAAKLRMGFGRASQQVKRSRALHHMPRTAEASGEGELSSEAVDLLVAAREAAPEAFLEAEPMLVDAAVALPPASSGRPSGTGARRPMPPGPTSGSGVSTRAATCTSPRC